MLLKMPNNIMTTLRCERHVWDNYCEANMISNKSKPINSARKNTNHSSIEGRASVHICIYQRLNRTPDSAGTSLAGPAGNSCRNTAIRFAVTNGHIMGI